MIPGRPNAPPPTRYKGLVIHFIERKKEGTCRLFFARVPCSGAFGGGTSSGGFFLVDSLFKSAVRKVCDSPAGFGSEKVVLVIESRLTVTL